MEITEALLMQVRSCGEMNFTLDQIIEAFKEPLPENFADHFENPESEIHKAYQLGKAITLENLNRSQLSAALQGDAETVSALELVKRYKKVDTIKQELFGI